MQCLQFSFHHLQSQQTLTVCEMRYQGNPRTLISKFGSVTHVLVHNQFCFAKFKYKTDLEI